MIWCHSYRYKCDLEYFRICHRDRPFNLKRGWEGVMLWFFPKKYFDAEFSRKNYFCKQNARKKYSDARFLPIKIAFCWLQGRNLLPWFMPLCKVIKEYKKLYRLYGRTGLKRETITFSDSKGLDLKEVIPNCVSDKLSIVARRGATVFSEEHQKDL